MRTVLYIFLSLIIITWSKTAHSQIKKYYYVNYESTLNEIHFLYLNAHAKELYREQASDSNGYIAMYGTAMNGAIHIITTAQTNQQARDSYLMNNKVRVKSQLDNIYSKGRFVTSCGKSPFERQSSVVSEYSHDDRKYYFHEVGNLNTWIDWIESDRERYGPGVPYLLCNINGDGYAFFVEQKPGTAIVRANTEREFRVRAKQLYNMGYYAYRISGSGGWIGTFIKTIGGTLLKPSTAIRYEDYGKMREGIEEAQRKGWSPVNITLGYKEYFNINPIENEDKIIYFK